jgi:ADP-heptose:LPS heptosyltransferase
MQGKQVTHSKIIEMRTITVPAGIGDNIWLFQKLVHANERFDFVLPDGKPQRGHQIFELLPEVAASYKYAPGLSYNVLNRNNIQRVHKEWWEIEQQEFCLSCNQHLESGKRIEEFLPDLPTAFRINWLTTKSDWERAVSFTTKYNIGIYCSSYAGSRNWGTWTATEWARLIDGMYRKNPAFVFVIIGAQWDADMTGEVMRMLDLLNIPYINTIGEPLGVVIEILKRLDYFIGFPSGLSILNETLGKRTFMFYAEQIKGIMQTWADLDRIVSMDCIECLFCPPEKALDIIFDIYKLMDKI